MMLGRGTSLGLVNASNLRIGDSVHDGVPVVYPGIPVFAPELISTARPTDVSNQKRFRKGLEQLAAEGVIQILHRPGGDATPILAAVGAMQFEVLVHRLEHEFRVPRVSGTSCPRTVRRTDSATAAQLSSVSGVDVLERDDGTLLALFASPYRLQRLVTENPECGCLIRSSPPDPGTSSGSRSRHLGIKSPGRALRHVTRCCSTSKNTCSALQRPPAARPA